MDTDLYNSIFTIIDSIEAQAYRNDDEQLLTLAIELEDTLNAHLDIDDDVLVSIADKVDDISYYLLENGDYENGTALLGASETLLEIADDYATTRDAILSAVASGIEAEIESEKEAIEAEIEEYYTESTILYSDDDEPDDIIYIDGVDERIASDAGYSLVMSDEVPDGYGIRMGSANTDITSVIAYADSIGIDGLSLIVYDERDELYYAYVRDDSP